MDGHVEFIKWTGGTGLDNPFPMNEAGFNLHLGTMGALGGGGHHP
jgi:hypothetical protein